ncbi:HU family DNA-binding protein [Paracoccus haeundaensis]|uniref:Integration host factor subunit beta n=1 Tax=Paracoccus haeundaensis TaxID=225362 RepID=A0A5C4R1V5_9RHOB|nr:HU family DNA-binding protein [Paracoccus haeundaensis]TNH37781.1 integration host factor subunit beta [Paracoccus haeundaensis]
MIRSQLVGRLVKAHPHLPQSMVEAALDTILIEIMDRLARGQRVEIRGFGSFATKIRDSRMGRNPKTGEPIQLNSKQIPRFRASKHLLEQLNRSRTAG